LILSQTEAVLALRGSKVLTKLESSTRLAFESEQEMHRDRLLFEMPGPGMSRERGGEEFGEMYTLGTNIPGAWCCVAAILSPQSASCHRCHFPQNAASPAAAPWPLQLYRKVVGLLTSGTLCCSDEGNDAIRRPHSLSTNPPSYFLAIFFLVNGSPGREYSGVSKGEVSGVLDGSRATVDRCCRPDPPSSVSLLLLLRIWPSPAQVEGCRVWMRYRS